MTRIDDLLALLAMAAGLGAWGWATFFGDMPPQALLLPVLLMGATILTSRWQRRAYHEKQQARTMALEQTMAEYQVLSDEAMAHADLQFTSLEKEMALAVKAETLRYI